MSRDALYEKKLGQNGGGGRRGEAPLVHHLCALLGKGKEKSSWHTSFLMPKLVTSSRAARKKSKNIGKKRGGGEDPVKSMNRTSCTGKEREKGTKEQYDRESFAVLLARDGGGGEGRGGGREREITSTFHSSLKREKKREENHPPSRRDVKGKSLILERGGTAIKRPLYLGKQS